MCSVFHMDSILFRFPTDPVLMLRGLWLLPVASYSVEQLKYCFATSNITFAQNQDKPPQCAEARSDNFGQYMSPHLARKKDSDGEEYTNENARNDKYDAHDLLDRAHSKVPRHFHMSVLCRTCRNPDATINTPIIYVPS